MIQSLAKHIEKALNALFNLSLAYPKSHIAGFLVLLALAILPLGQLRMLMDTDELIDSNFATYESLWNLKADFLERDKIFLLIRRKDELPVQKEQICTIRSWIQHIADTSGDISAIVSSLAIMWPEETTTRFKVSPLLDVDCTRADLDESAAIATANKKFADSPWAGTLVAKDGSDVGILLYPLARTEESFFGTFNDKIVDELHSSFTTRVLEPHPELEASWTGDSIFHYYLKKGYEAMPALNLLISILVVILFRVFYGTFRSSFVFLNAVGWVSLFVYAGMALSGHPIDVLTSALSLMIFVSSLEDFIFLMHHMKKSDWIEGYKRILVPSFYTSLTTAIGFGSLYLSDLEMIRRFGLWAASAALIEWGIFFLVLPALLAKFPYLRNLVKNSKSVNLPISIQKYRPKRWITLAALLVFPVGLWSSQKLYVSDSPERLLPPEHSARQALDMVEQTRGWRAEVSLVFADFEAKEFNLKVLNEMKNSRYVVQTEDIYSTTEYLSSHLTPSMAGFFSEAISNNTLGARLGPTFGQTRAMLYVKNLDIQEVNQMRARVDSLCPNNECWLAGSLVSYGELSSKVLSTLYKSLGGSLLLVSLVIFFLARAYRPKSFWPLLLSGMWGPLALLIVFYIFDIPVFYITSMMASILVGLAGDNAIHFLFGAQTESQDLEQSVDETAPAALIIALAMCLCSSVFFFGYFDPMKTLGLMLVVGIILSFLGDVWVLKGLTSKDR